MTIGVYCPWPRESNDGGRPANVARRYWAQRFGLSDERARKTMRRSMVSQLERCKDDEARRILLGISQ